MKTPIKNIAVVAVTLLAFTGIVYAASPSDREKLYIELGSTTAEEKGYQTNWEAAQSRLVTCQSITDSEKKDAHKGAQEARERIAEIERELYPQEATLEPEPSEPVFLQE